MTSLCCKVLQTLSGKSLVTAESLTGGGIGEELTAVPGASRVYKGGVICYTNWVKQQILGVPEQVLTTHGAVSEETAKAMAEGVRKLLKGDVAIAVTGLAGPGGDEFGNPVGTVFIGYAEGQTTAVKPCLFSGSREEIRTATIQTALEWVLELQQDPSH